VVGLHRTIVSECSPTKLLLVIPTIQNRNQQIFWHTAIQQLKYNVADDAALSDIVNLFWQPITLTFNGNVVLDMCGGLQIYLDLEFEPLYGVRPVTSDTNTLEQEVCLGACCNPGRIPVQAIADNRTLQSHRRQRGW
jgi:hypothetical protein